MAFVSILVRARNDEALIGRTLKGIFSQKVDFPYEVIVCDDASTDRTRDIASQFPVRFFECPQGPYKPGRTLNALVAAATGDIVVFNNSDAVPLDEHWLSSLVAPLVAEKDKPKFTFANQLPRPDAAALVRKDSERAFGDGKVQATWRFFFSLASSATWRKLLIETPFDEQIQYSEDVEWTWRNSRRSQNPVAIVYCPEAHVEHSHNYTLAQLAKRFRGEGAADRIIYGEAPSLLRCIVSAARETLRDFAYLAKRPACWKEIPGAPIRRLIQRIAYWRGTLEVRSSCAMRRNTGKEVRILLGGIPLGCDNIGDEAIIACVVKMLKESIKGVKLTVATADPATAGLLGVEVAPAFGFAGRSLEGFGDLVRSHDAYVWCGATGLSDYPDVALDLLEIAQEAGVATFIWGVGMDDELNPAFFLASGGRKAILSRLGLVGWYEGMLRKRLAKRIAKLLPRCKGVWLRDPESVRMLATMGYPNAGVTADTAILCVPRVSGRARRDAGTSDGNRCGAKLGLCISTQRQVADLDGVKEMIASVRAAGASVIGIPMNPMTDRALLEKLGVECCEGNTPEAVCEAAAECDVVLSSRLHLLILASNAGTPILGIARGSKLANWLANFGRTVEGGVYDCDWRKVTEHVLAALRDRGDWDEVRDAAYSRLMARFSAARAEFIRFFNQ